MKPAPFDYTRVEDVAGAVARLAAGEGAVKALAGGQSLGPMLNLRLAQPAALVDVRAVASLGAVTDDGEGLRIGAAVTHAAIEDGCCPGRTGALLAHVAAGIAYRAVRNRGTIGGSLCHADPSADWPGVMLLLDAGLVIEGANGRRSLTMREFLLGPFWTALAPDELLVEIRLPHLSATTRWGYCKFARKPGEFAEAIGAVLVDPARGMRRALLGALPSGPRLVADADFLDGGFDAGNGLRAIEDAGGADDPCERRMRLAVLARAASQAGILPR